MKKLVVNLLGITIILVGTLSNAHASDTAQLEVNISGAQQHNYYVCVNDVGCLKTQSAKQRIPINAMNVRYIFLADGATYQMFPQNLPESCNVAVNGDQKLIVKGSFSKDSHNKVHIANLQCSVVS